ncbi:MAG: asparagine synthase-related protein [Pseudonocardiaceae bacterium]
MGVVIEGWMVLPDRPDAWRAAADWPSGVRCVMAHASGNPFLIGSLAQRELILAMVGSLRVAVIGVCPVTATRLSELVARVRTVAELDAVAGVLPGCWHLVASLDGVVRVQGSLSGLRRVFHTRIGDVPVAGERADALARVAAAGIDERVLAARVSCGSHVPPPLGEHSFWRGVRALAPDHYLRIDPPGRVSEPRWWSPPEPRLSLSVGADAVRQALETAVAARQPTGGRLSADLSGGLDSTSLCFLAARAGVADLLTFRWAEAESGNDDSIFAAHAIGELPLAEHVVLPQAEMPGIFADAGDNGDTEAPYRFTRTLARSRHNAQLLAARGAREHLAGHGGDELFHNGNKAYLSALVRRRPITAIRHLRGYRALGRWSWLASVSALVRRGEVGAWWDRQATELTSGPPPRRTPDLDWGYPLRAAVWVTPEAVDTARAVLRATGETAPTVRGERAQEIAVSILRTMGPQYRQVSRVFSTAGLRLELPYFDDRVIEAALAVRPHERATPWRYKPLLVEAMRPILPEVIANRTTKGEFGEDVRVGWRRHLPDILELFADSALATHGLINPDLLRRELLKPQVDNTAMFALEDLLGCETWLRAIQTPPSPRRTDAATAAP